MYMLILVEKRLKAQNCYTKCNILKNKTLLLGVHIYLKSLNNCMNIFFQVVGNLLTNYLLGVDTCTLIPSAIIIFHEVYINNVINCYHMS